MEKLIVFQSPVTKRWAYLKPTAGMCKDCIFDSGVLQCVCELKDTKVTACCYGHNPYHLYVNWQPLQIYM